MLRRWKLIAIFAVLVLIIAAYLIHKRQSSAAKVVTIHPALADIAQTIDVSGVVDAKQKAVTRFAAGGKLVYLGAQEGDTVKKGQTIASIDAADLQNRLQENLNLFMNQRLTFDQNRETNAQVNYTNVIDRSQQKDQNTLNNTVLDVQYQDIAIQNARLSAPLAGILVQSPATVPGVTLLSTDTFTIINPASLMFKAEVDQADIAKVQKGMPVSVKLDAYPDAPIRTTVSYLSYTSSQSSTGTVYLVQMPLPLDPAASPAAQLARFRLGMNGDAQIILAEKKQVLTVPLSATKESNGKTLVTIRQGDGKQVDREIQTGLENDTTAEVTGGLTEQDEVVVP